MGTRRGRMSGWGAVLLLVGGVGLAGAPATPVSGVGEPLLSKPALVRHAARYARSEACVVPRPGPAAGPAPADTGAVTGQVTPELDALPGAAVTVVTGRVLAAEAQVTVDGSRVFTVYRFAVEAVERADVAVPVAVGQTIIVSRPGGRVPQGGRTAVVVVAGFGPLAVGERRTVALVAADGGEGYHEVRRSLPGGAGGGR